MHLLNALEQISTGISTERDTYNLLQPKQLLPLLSQIHVANSNLPALVTPSDLRTQCTADNLMSEADPENTHPILRQDLLRELNQAIDPWDILKRIVF
jgi:hypothetical protein